MSDRIPVSDVTSPFDPQLSAEGSTSHSLYERRRHIYVREISGVFQCLRRSANWVLILCYLVVPWIPWGDRPAVWFDLPGREFHIFATTFYPQEFMLLSWLLIICAFGMFFITVFAGRVWCGYACPQSIWTLVYIWVEHRIEGSRHQRIRLDQQPWTIDKLWRKVTKHLLWLLIALVTAVTFVGYFTPIGELLRDLSRLQAHGWAWFWMGFFLVFTYLNAGWLREQVCTHMCPYARFQSVMFDRDTLIVSYDPQRGEPRGARKRHLDPEAAALGHCIDCELCVQVCPTGIDIREGLQAQCISCAACIDACDSVMDRMGYPRGLVRYTTEQALDGRPTRLLRPRLLGYLSALIIMVAVFTHAIADRTPLDVDIQRDRGQLFQTLNDGSIANSITIIVRNLDHRDHQYRIAVSGLDGLRSDVPPITVPAGASRQRVMTLSIDPDRLEQRSTDIRITVTATDTPDMRVARESRFMGVSRQ